MTIQKGFSGRGGRGAETRQALSVFPSFSVATTGMNRQPVAELPGVYRDFEFDGITWLSSGGIILLRDVWPSPADPLSSWNSLPGIGEWVEIR